jgi:hypothetical protein
MSDSSRARPGGAQCPHRAFTFPVTRMIKMNCPFRKLRCPEVRLAASEVAEQMLEDPYSVISVRRK